MEELEQLKEHILNINSQQELFNLMGALLDEISYDWLNKDDNWLAISHYLYQYGHTDLASVFDLANRQCLKLVLEGK